MKRATSFSKQIFDELADRRKIRDLFYWREADVRLSITSVSRMKSAPFCCTLKAVCLDFEIYNAAIT
jgi:hypothetical protein